MRKSENFVPIWLKTDIFEFFRLFTLKDSAWWFNYVLINIKLTIEIDNFVLFGFVSVFFCFFSCANIFMELVICACALHCVVSERVFSVFLFYFFYRAPDGIKSSAEIKKKTAKIKWIAYKHLVKRYRNKRKNGLLLEINVKSK